MFVILEHLPYLWDEPLLNCIKELLNHKIRKFLTGLLLYNLAVNLFKI